MTLGENKSDPALGNVGAKRCRRCGLNLERISRGKYIKLFWGWLPMRRYFCYGCLHGSWRIPERRS